MENKRFNYIEFKIDVINNELKFLENYLLTHIDKIDQNSLTNLKEKLTNLINKLTQMEQNYSVVKEDGKKEVETVVKEIDILKYNEDLVHKVSQINYII
jgi:dsRNA-specific ribonuclease